MPYPDIDPVLLSLGPLQIRWYALAYIAGILAGWWYLIRLLKQPELWTPKGAGPGALPLTKAQLDDVIFYVTLGIILGGRLGFVFFYRPELLAVPFGEWDKLLGFLPVPPALAIWQGGMSFHGGLIGVAVSTFYFARKYKLNPVGIGDLFACAAPIGLFFGRIANFINAELYGRPSDVPWAVRFPEYYDRLSGEWIYAADAVPRHPSQLYEAGLEGLILFGVLWYAVHRLRVLQYKGAAIGIFLAGYGLSRFIVEFFREPDDYKYAGPLGFLTRGMMLSVPMIVLGLWFAWHVSRKKQQAA
ncbi:prolipoprotein diacylglyceryl transferase [Parvularcula sp. LCG005]|uniref:prolipoprotein diacylglyceryl transferase n=1 Tax=Parvularcula sp. LCG005 TaxID=3078805 RepID=UPI00294373F7|nr:prolipoprotein diacylglyceryl transferase [Parvularcula sp. LCG005]WOI54631.1 prolipoprotein diacylglyceryl transferase [Parvularcula sp. LCG005]